MAVADSRRRAVRLALRLYPRWWRERYGEELLDVVEQRGIGWPEVAGLFRCGVTERLRPLRRTATSGTARRLVVASACAYPAWLATVAAFWGIMVAGLTEYGLRWTAPRPPLVAGVLGMTAAYVTWTILFALPCIGILLAAGAGRFPMAARVMTAGSFLLFPALMVGTVSSSVAGLVTGALFAVVLFPSTSISVSLKSDTTEDAS